MYYQKQVSQQNQLQPLIDRLSISQTEKSLFQQLLGAPTASQIIQNQQYFAPQLYQQHPLSFGYHSQFIPAFPQYQLPYVQASNVNPLPLNYNLGQLVHQPGNQIRLGFDLTQFGVPNELPQIRLPEPKPKPPRKPYPEIPDNYLEQIELPRIKLQDEEQYRIIYQKQKPPRKHKPQKSDDEEETEREQEKNQRQVRNRALQIKQQQPERSRALRPKEVGNKESGSKKGSSSAESIFKSESQKQNQKKTNRRLPQETIVEQPVETDRLPIIKKLNKQEWLRRTRIFKISIRFLSLYLRTVRSIIEKKKEVALEKTKIFSASAYTQFMDWLDPRIEKPLIELLNNTQDFQLQLGQDKPNATKKKFISELLRKIIDGLTKSFKPDELIKGDLLEYLKIITTSYSFPPPKYLLKFETLRLPFTSFGSFGELTQDMKRMILLNYFIVRLVLFANLFKVWQFHPDQSNKDQLFLIQRNSIILVSIIHDIVVKWIAKTIPMKKRPSEELKKVVDFLEYPLSEDVASLEKEKKQFADYIEIEGVLPLSLLQKYTITEKGAREQWIDQTEVDLIKWIDQILEVLRLSESRANQKQDRMIELMVKFESQQRKNKK